MNVLVTNGNSRMALCIARALKKLGHRVVVADYMKNAMCFFSNKIDDKFIYPSPFSDPDQFIAEINKEVLSKKIDIIIPVHEETFLFAREKEKLNSSVSLPVPSYESILKVHNKDSLNSLLQDLLIHTPKTMQLDQFHNFQEVAKEFKGQVVLKPRQGGGNWGLQRLQKGGDYSAQIEEYLGKIKIDPSRILVQEWIPVLTKFSHVVVYQKNQFVQDFADEHLRDFPLGGGAGVLRKTCDPSPMRSISQRLFDEIGWHGIAEVEYALHVENGKYYLVEINPRVWGGVNSAISSGFDIISMLVDIARCDTVSPRPYVFGKQTRWFWGDMKVFPAYYASSKSKGAVLLEYARLLFDDTKTDEFYFDDPLPFFAWPAHALYKILKYRSLNPVAYDSLSGEWE